MKKIVSLVLALSLMCSMVSMFSIVSFSAAKDDAWTCGDCVRYAKARFREIWGFDLHPAYSDSADGYYYNASSSGDTISSTPKTGALAIWKGHVAIVESVSGSYVTYSEGGFEGHFNQETRHTSSMSKTNQPFLGYVYINGTHKLSKPKTASLSIDKTNLLIGENFTLFCNSDEPCLFYCSIFDADTNEKAFEGNILLSYTTAFLKAGHYVAYISAYNSQGTVDSKWIDFYVFGDPPTTAKIKADKDLYELGETVVLKTYTDAYYVKIYISIFNGRGEKVYEGNIPYTFKYTPTKKDKYSCYISAYTHVGGVDSKMAYFYVGEYVVNYDVNGGTNAPSTQTKKYGESIAISPTEPTRDGYIFLGWSTDKNATEPDYLPGDTYSENKDVTLYAVWEEVINEFTFTGEIETFGSSEDAITFEFIKAGETEVCHSETLNGDSLTYEFFGIENGEYTMRVSKNNHVAREYEVVVGTEDINVDVQLNLIGDINGDGKITLLDYTQVLKHVKKTSSLDGYTFECADVNGDGKITLIDYTKILKHVKKTENLW